MTDSGKHFADNTAKNCGLNCFMGSRQKIKASQSASFWPKFRRRVKHDGKTTTEYAVKISPGGERPRKSESFVLSVSQGGELIPVKILSPVGKEENTQKNSVKKRTKERKAGRRSWVRMAVGAFGFSTKKSLIAKVIQDPPQQQQQRDSEILAVQTIAPADSNDRPAEQPSEVLNSGVSVEKPSEVAPNAHNRKPRCFDRLHGQVSAPCSPEKRASSPSTSYSNLPHADVALLRHTPPRSIKVHRLASTAVDSEAALKNSPHCDAVIGFSVLIIILFFLAISDRLFAIICTSIWWYAVPKLRSLGKAEKQPLKKPEAKKLLTKSLSNNNVDLHSSEYRKRVIMEGILQRNPKAT